MFGTLFAVAGVGVFIYGVLYSLAVSLLDCDLHVAFYEKFGKSPRRLKGKVVFITGASSGIGEYIAYALAKHGVKLVLTARRNDELQRVKKTCIDISNGTLSDKDVLVIPMDVTDTSSHKMHFMHAVRYFGIVDILVNNAGRSQRALWEKIDLIVDKQMFDLNVFAVVNLSRVAIEYFKTKSEGHVAVVSSLAGVIGAPYSGSYTGSKHAIHGYFNSLRNEKAEENLTVTLLCPGPTFSNFLSESFTDTPDEKYNQTTQPTDKRMTAERCGQICAVALANKSTEVWMGLFPVLPYTYVSVYWPTIFKIVMKFLGPKVFSKLRDTRDSGSALTENKKN